MEYILMNTNRPILSFDDEYSYLNVIDNDFLPYSIKDYVISTDRADSIRTAIKHLSALKDFLIARTLNLSREHAKVILNIAALPQSLKPSEKLKIVYACRGLNMEDNFWIKTEKEKLTFDDINLRNKHLSESSYDIAILGRHISATLSSLETDLMLGGMFPKYWHRNGKIIELWKTDKSGGLNCECEVKASQLLNEAKIPCIIYRKAKRDGLVFSVCDCMTDDDTSLVKATDIADWCRHTNKDFSEFLKNYEKSFANMVIADFVLGNTDRHMENWGFLINNSTNKIISLAPLYDLNQALVIDTMGNSNALGELIYEPCNISFNEAAEKYAPLSDIEFGDLPTESKKRWDTVISKRLK